MMLQFPEMVDGNIYRKSLPIGSSQQGFHVDFPIRKHSDDSHVRAKPWPVSHGFLWFCMLFHGFTCEFFPGFPWFSPPHTGDSDAKQQWLWMDLHLSSKFQGAIGCDDETIGLKNNGLLTPHGPIRGVPRGYYHGTIKGLTLAKIRTPIKGIRPHETILGLWLVMVI